MKNTSKCPQITCIKLVPPDRSIVLPDRPTVLPNSSTELPDSSTELPDSSTELSVAHIPPHYFKAHCDHGLRRSMWWRACDSLDSSACNDKGSWIGFRSIAVIKWSAISRRHQIYVVNLCDCFFLKLFVEFPLRFFLFIFIKVSTERRKYFL